jgi:hypothetical protein
MARFGFIGSAYTSRSSSIADEELINLFLESDGSGQGQSKASFFASPGLSTFLVLDVTADVATRGSVEVNGRVFVVVGAQLYEVFADKTKTARGAIADDGKPVTIVKSALELCIIAAGKTYSFVLATNALTDVTAQMLGVPIHACFCDGYFLVIFKDSQKIQFCSLFDGTTWPGLNVLQVSVFADNLVSIVEDHREVIVMGSRHGVVYYDSASSNVFDVIQGSKFEHGNAATFSHIKIDNTDFWIERDDDGNCMARKMGGGYVPQRVSTYGVEWQWQGYSDVSDAVSYTIQIGGHTFWRIYFPTGNMTWQYDIGENSWSKLATWSNGTYSAHSTQNHIFAFGKHLVGDPFSGTLYETSMDLYDYAGSPRRWLRRTATVYREMEWIFHDRLTVDADPGISGTVLPGTPSGPNSYVLTDNIGGQWFLQIDSAGNINLNATSGQTASTIRINDSTITQTWLLGVTINTGIPFLTLTAQAFVPAALNQILMTTTDGLQQTGLEVLNGVLTLIDAYTVPRGAQIMCRWSNDRGKTWATPLVREIGIQGDYKARAIWFRLGRSRYRVYEISGSDPVPWVLVDAYLLASGYQPVERLTQTLSKTS